MAATVTRAEVRSLARLYADQRPDGGKRNFIPAGDVDDLINLAIAELWDDLVAARGHEYYARKSPAFGTVAGTALYNLPVDFYELISIGIAWNLLGDPSAGDTDRLEPIPAIGSLADAHLFNGLTWGEGTRKAHRITNAQVEFFPIPNAANTIILRYVPTCPKLTADSGTNGSFDGINGWERVVALNVAIQMRAISGREVGDIVELYDRDVKRIRELAEDRNATAAPRIRDVSPEGALLGAGWIDPILPPPTG